MLRECPGRPQNSVLCTWNHIMPEMLYFTFPESLSKLSGLAQPVPSRIQFSTFIHEQAKVEFMSQNAMDPKKQAILGMVALPGYEVLGYVPSPRFIKTHLPFSLLPPNLLESGAKVDTAPTIKLATT
uniref:Uncharacterized protein n=1 Tax=Timema monikensis TaxID=170555 RepID=A0A7R9E791_9NEOP|nr:unnamed protein product [Timema monikensis]